MTKAEISANRAKRVVKIAGQIEDDYKVTIVKYLKNAKGEYNWLFNWEDGGFNDVWAKTKEEAIAKVKAERAQSKKKYPTHTLLVADEKSFRKATQETATAQDRMGHMMSC